MPNAMSNASKTALVLITLIVGSSLIGCGQKGPLTMPQDSQPESTQGTTR